ncbi:MAG: YqeG family HAD IIIA-type phosphatase [Oscillospiraceae bacterium]|nr:YqeG family HAD IIIA-type phosphatase [Oscillospiraceae bacterium]
MFNLYKFRSVTDISPAFLQKLGVKCLLLDIDNTLMAYSAPLPPPELAAWTQSIQAAGIELRILSNAKSETRANTVAAHLGVRYSYNSKKPRTKKARALTADYPDKKKLAAVGDQFFTDGLEGVFLGARSVLVRPLVLSGRGLMPVMRRLRYYAELPFRLLAKNGEELS